MATRNLELSSFTVSRRHAARAVTTAVAIAAVLATRAPAQPPQFSGATCSMTSCDCNCIAGEEQKAARAVESLGVDLPPSLTRTPDRLSPAAALTRLRTLHKNVAHVLLLLQAAERDAIGAATLAEIHAGMPEAAAELGLPAPPAGWSWDERYLGSLDNSIRTEIGRVFPLTERQAQIEKELNSCQQWADHKKCDPSLGVRGGSTPPREMPPSPPPVVTPPRELPPSDGPLPIGHHPDGRVRMTDELISRYVAASKARYLQGGASYWQAGRMGQADYAEIDARVLEWTRYKDTPAERYARFDDAEQEVLTRRAVEVTKAYNGDW